MPIRNLPAETRPRERLAQKGTEALSAIELLAILIRSGTRNKSAIDLAAELLSHFQSLEKIGEATLSELSSIKGIGAAKAVLIKAAFGLAKRVSNGSCEIDRIDSPEKAFRILLPLLEGEKTEVLYILLRDVRGNLIHKEEIGRGTLTQVIVHPREVYYPAIRHRAHNVILAHNHPSGDPSPSKSDREVTAQVHEAGKTVGIPLVDHIILGKSEFYSFRERGLLGPSNSY